jgi:tape measure domain-containing protein
MTQTINLANIRIGMDIDKLKEGGIKARQELSLLSRALRDGADPFQKFAEKKAILDRALATGGINDATHQQMVAGLKKTTGVAALEEETRRNYEQNRERRQQMELQDQLRAEARQKAEFTRIREQEQQAKMVQEAAAKASEAAAAERRSKYLKMLKYNSQLMEDERQRQIKREKEMMQLPQAGALDNFLQTITVRAIAYSVAYKAIGASKEAVAGTIREFMKFENSMVQLTVLTGSKSAAKQLYEDFRRLDKQSPLSTQQFEQAAVTLLGYGASVKSITPTLEALSQISMGNEERFRGLALAFAQVQANGRLMGQEVIQMVNAGFNPLQQISKDTGKSMLQLKRDMENGAISAYMVGEALKNATKEGGRFYMMNEYLSRTMSGRLAKLQSEVARKQQQVGAMFGGSLGASVDVATNAISNYDPMIAMAGTYAMDKGLGGMLHHFITLNNVLNNGDAMRAFKDRAEKEDAFNKLLEAEADKQMQIIKSLQEQKDALHEKVTLMTMGAEELDRQKSMMTGVEIGEFQQLTALKNQVIFMERKREIETEMLQAADARKEIEKRIYEERVRGGMTDADAFALQQLEEQLRVQKEISARKKEDAEMAERQFMTQQRDAFRLFQDSQKPQEKFLDDLAKVRELFTGGFIDQNTLDKTSLRLAQDVAKAMVPAGVAPTLKANSTEAYQFVQKQNEQNRIANEAKKLAQEGNKHLEKIEQALLNAAVVAKRRP